MKRFLPILFLLPPGLKAQDKLMVQGSSPGLYLNHAVAPKENIYSIGRMFNVSPKDNLAPFNGITVDKGLSPGQVLKIPLTPANFLQNGKPAVDEVTVPVYYIVGEKEGLFRVSVKNNKVPMEMLKKWNSLTTDAVSTGNRLIVGFLKVKKDISSLASKAMDIPENNNVVNTKKDNGPPVVFDPPKPPVKNPNLNPGPDPVKKDPPKPVVPNDKVTVVTTKGTGDNFNGGVFKALYGSSANNDQEKENGAAGVFKSSSGWEDGKYYCLHNTAQPGTIIKVTNDANGKAIYAKVLDVIPDIRQNSGLIIRISNSAADILGVGENKFDCSLMYAK